MLHETNLSDEQKSKLRKLAWAAFGSFVVSAAKEVGSQAGKALVEWLKGGSDDDDEEDDEPEEPV